MCDPITLIGIAATVGSTGLNAVASNRVQKATDEAMLAENLRQRRFDEESAALSTKSQDRYQDFGEQQEARKTELTDFFTAPPAEGPPVGAAMPQSSSNLVVREENKKRQKARDYTDQQGAALADLRSFGDLLGGIGREQGRDASLIGQIGGFKRGSQAVLPHELDAAANSANGTKMFADVLGGIGSVATMAGLSGASLPSIFKSSGPMNLLPAGSKFMPTAKGAMRAIPQAMPSGLASLY